MGNTDSSLELQQISENGFIQDEATRKQELYNKHLYLEDPEDLVDEFLDPSPLIIPEVGFRVELGGISKTPEEARLEEVEKHSPYYFNNFCNKEHYNFIGGSASSPVVISAIRTEKIKNVYLWKVLYRNKKGDYILQLRAKNKKTLLKQLRVIGPDLVGDVPLFEVKGQEIIDNLKHMEDRHLIKAYKIGIVYCKEGQVHENDMFSNQKKSKEFEEFLNWIGEKIKLKGYQGYRGGLDVVNNTTGIYSYRTEFEGFHIMFHVSTELPYDSKNPQQVERKRHIGNDVVVIVFQDGPNGGFKPSTITSKFNHVYAIIQPVKRKRTSRRNNKKNDQSETKYRIAFVSKHGVRYHGPALPNNKYVWPKNDETRRFLLTKLLNAERAAYYAPGFGQTRSRRLWLKEILDKYQAKILKK